MNRSLLLLAAAALLHAGCGPSTPIAAPPPSEGKTTDSTAAYPSEGGRVKLNGNNTKIEFVGSKPNGDKHSGTFKSLTGHVQQRLGVQGQNIKAEEQTLIAGIDVEIDADSLTTDIERLTNHLKSDDFFKVKKHPKITFKSTKIAPTKSGDPRDALVTGDLTIAGVTKAITFPVRRVDSERGFHLTASFKVNRKEVGITYESPQGKINDDVEVTVTVGGAPAKKG